MKSRIARAIPWLALTSVVSLVGSAVVLFFPVTAAGAPASSAVTLKRTMDPGYSSTEPPGKYKAEVTVSQTSELVRQRVKVSWSGLKPSGTGNNDGAYPVVVMQCWGTPAEVTQQTCWNAGDHVGQLISPNAVFDPHPLDPAIYGPGPYTNSGGYAVTVPFKARDDGKLYSTATNYNWPAGALVEHSPPAYSPATQNAVTNLFSQGFTNPDGSGAADIELLTGFENPHLGCSSTAACSLVVIPVGDPTCKADKDLPPRWNGYCKARYAIRDYRSWVSQTNWERRFTFPLSFRESSATCQLDNRQETGFAGSFSAFQLLNSSWRARFCRDKDLFRLGYTALPDGDARSQFTGALTGTWQDGSTNALLTSRPMPGDPPKPVVYAPVAVTGVAVSFVLDDNQGKEVTQLNLNARLLAKMITQSYRTTAAVGDQNPGVGNNPKWWGTDPEFLALNPKLKLGISFLTEGFEYPVISLGDLDAIYALTSYIASDKDAVAWLNGANDGYGMFVNPKFHNYQVPVGLLELRDDFVPTTNNTGAPFYKQILLSVYANTADNLYNAATAITQAWPYATLQKDCLDISRPETCGILKRGGRQPGRSRALLGITTLGDSTVFGLRQASLATPSGAFVKPDDYSLALALRGTKLDEKTGVLSTDFPKLHPLAYPGTSIVYAAIPTTGLSPTTANNYATFLDYAAGPGQVPGLAAGQLPSGYVPLSDPMRQQTRNAAAAVRDQKGAVPPPPPALGTDPAAGLLPPPGTDVSPNNTSPTGGTYLTPTGGTSPNTSSAPATGSISPSVSSTPSTVHQPATSVATRTDSSSFAKWVLPGLLGLGVLAGVVAFGVAVATEPQHPLRRALRTVLRRS